MGDFFGELFDFSFLEFITPKIIKVVYGLAIAMAGLVALVIILVGFSDSNFAGVVAIVVAGVYFLASVVFTRVVLEFIMVTFRIADSTRETAELLRRNQPHSSSD